MMMRLALAFLLLGLGLRGLSAPQAPLSSPVSEDRLAIALTNALRDAWPGIAEATNSWAVFIRERADWTNAIQVSFARTLAEAEKGSAVSQLKLGYSYFTGEGIDRDFAAANQWLEKAAGAKLAPAEFLVGVASLNGLGRKQDFEGAVEWLNRSAEQGFADAQFQLGLCYLRGGPGVNQAPARGVKWLTRAAEQGKANAQQFLAWCYASGNGVQEDPAQAFQWCAKAAESGSENAQDFLGMFWATGYGTNVDWGEAVKCFSRAAARGLGTAQLHLAQCYAAGRGVEKNPARAFQWWREAATQGYPSAQFHVGLGAYDGMGTSKDFDTAAIWFRKAAEQQHVGAELYLGLCYAKGHGVEADADVARKWWREAAVQGIAPRLAEMGDDAADVERWWQVVAGQGDVRLQCCLAEFYRFGRGIAQDDLKALKWYRQASATGDVAALEGAAWLMSVSLQAEVRDGRAAVELARKAVSATKRKSARALDVLAAAYAEAGQFSKAISSENDAIAVALEDEEKQEYRSRLKLYQAKVAYRAQESGSVPAANR